MSPPTRTVLPNIEPILVIAGSPPLHDPRWIYEPKFDGFRGVLYLCRGECYIRSKRSNVLAFARQHLIAKAEAGKATDRWLAAAELYLGRAVQ